MWHLVLAYVQAPRGKQPSVGYQAFLLLQKPQIELLQQQS